MEFGHAHCPLGSQWSDIIVGDEQFIPPCKVKDGRSQQTTPAPLYSGFFFVAHACLCTRTHAHQIDLAMAGWPFFYDDWSP
mmetsp:Transcript_23078/g.22819  ORF Transcript_23078/g.22819 Transcript_23078/m.22819 type:complete len:81 (-) Transcript_23078:63-305(-)